MDPHTEKKENYRIPKAAQKAGEINNDNNGKLLHGIERTNKNYDGEISTKFGQKKSWRNPAEFPTSLPHTSRQIPGVTG